MKLRRRLKALEEWKADQGADREIFKDEERRIRLMAPELGIAPDRLLEIFREEAPSGVLDWDTYGAMLWAVDAEKKKQNSP